MRSSAKWLLVETLDRDQPGVIAVGSTPKRRVPLASFVGTGDRSDVMAAVSQGVRRRAPTMSGSTGRKIEVAPILGISDHDVHAVWLRISTRTNQHVVRPSAWAFVWDLDNAVAYRGAIASEDESWASLGIAQYRSIASGLSHLQLGSSITPILAQLISANDGVRLQKRAVERRPDGSTREIQFYARFSVGEHVKRIKGSSRLIRGVSVDLGPSNDRVDPSLAELITRAKSEPNERTAIIDPATFEVLYWHGSPPTDLLWNTTSALTQRPFLHPADKPKATKAVEAIGANRSRFVELDLRLLSAQLNYSLRAVSFAIIRLNDDSKALLATVKSL